MFSGIELGCYAVLKQMKRILSNLVVSAYSFRSRGFKLELHKIMKVVNMEIHSTFQMTKYLLSDMISIS